MRELGFLLAKGSWCGGWGGDHEATPVTGSGLEKSGSASAGCWVLGAGLPTPPMTVFRETWL